MVEIVTNISPLPPAILAQSVEQVISNDQVVGSSPIDGTIPHPMECSSVVERLTVNQVVAGSNPAIPVASIAQRIVQCFCKAKVVCSNQTGGIWGSSSAGLEHRTVTAKVVGSSPIYPVSKEYYEI